jgi:membrane-associated protein
METAQQFLMEYGLWAVALGAFFQGYLLVIGAGLLVSRNILAFEDVLIVTAAAAWIGHLFWFYLGRCLKNSTFMKMIPGWEKNHKFVNRLIDRKRKLSVFLLQYLFGLRLIGAIEFGLARIPAGWFAIAQIVNCTLWAFILMVLGYSFGEMTEHPGIYAMKYLWISGSFICLLLAVHWYTRSDPTSDVIDQRSRT